MKWIKALSIGLQILSMLEKNPTGEEIELPPIYVTNNGRKWEFDIKVKCMEK